MLQGELNRIFVGWAVFLPILPLTCHYIYSGYSILIIVNPISRVPKHVLALQALTIFISPLNLVLKDFG